MESEPDDGLPSGRRMPAVITVLLCIAMTSVNITLINIALPSMARDVGVSAASGIFIVSIYQLVLLSLLLAVSTLGDVFGFRRIFLIGIAVFGAASLGCALSGGFPSLLAWRILQGLGATAIQGSYLSLMTLIYPGKLLGRGMGLSATVFALTSIAGPSVAAFILSYGNWRHLFYINIPFALITLALGWRYLPANRPARDKRLPAAADVILHVLAFALFFVAASGWAYRPGQWQANVAATVLCAVTAWIYARRQKRQTQPFFPIDLFERRTFRLAVVFAVLSFTCLLMMIIAFPFVFKARYGYSPAQIGFLLTILSCASILSSLAAGYGMEKMRPSRLCAAGFALFFIGVFSLSLLPETTGAVDIGWRLALCGIGGGLIQPTINFMTMNSSSPDRRGAASGVVTTAMVFGQVWGMLAAAAFFSVTGSENTMLPFTLSGVIAVLGGALALGAKEKVIT